MKLSVTHRNLRGGQEKLAFISGLARLDPQITFDGRTVCRDLQGSYRHVGQHPHHFEDEIFEWLGCVFTPVF